MKKLIYKDLFRYILLIQLGFCLDFLIFFLLTYAAINIYFAQIFAFIIGASCNVLVLRAYFKPSKFDLLKDLFFTYFNNGLILILSILCLYLLYDTLRIDLYISKILTGFFTLFANYFSRRVFFS